MLSDDSENGTPVSSNGQLPKITADLLKKHSDKVTAEFQDDFEKVEITYRVQQFFTGDQGIHVREKMASLKVVLSDEERYLLLTLKPDFVFYIPLTEVQSIEVHTSSLGDHWPIILLAVTDSILSMFYQKKPSILQNRRNDVMNRVPASLYGNLLIVHLRPVKNVESEKPILCDANFCTQERQARYILDEDGALSLLRYDVENWLIESSPDSYELKFDVCSPEKWYKIMDVLQLVSIFENEGWRLEPKRHVLRINPITSMFLMNTPEKLYELHPPWHPTPMLIKTPEENNETDQSNEDRHKLPQDSAHQFTITELK